ncbi:hypothetical protein KY289_034892 [Solanum tuberosum]|nr:hypothetical protein KY289_034892 [Solanum tuberosum]
MHVPKYYAYVLQLFPTLQSTSKRSRIPPQHVIEYLEFIIPIQGKIVKSQVKEYRVSSRIRLVDPLGSSGLIPLAGYKMLWQREVDRCIITIALIFRYPRSAACTSLIQLSTPESVDVAGSVPTSISVTDELRKPGQGFAWASNGLRVPVPPRVSKRQRVVALALPNLHLQGTISPSLANLSFLSVLNLENNLFNGGIPYELGHLPRLRVIDIQNNQLQGSIPSSLFQHRRVQVISLAFNKLSGEMWKGTCLSGNRINGNIPTEIGNLSQLAFLFLTDNQLTGFIPTSLFNISSLLSVSLAFNSLSGPLLLDEGNIVSNLKFLSLSMNQISGCVPSNICQLTELKVLSISYNKITGDIPRNIGCLSKLERFYIGYNRIKGTIPASLGNISTLHNLYCGNNRIVGQIPPELGKLSNLRQLSFGQNYNLIGQIPEAIFNTSSLEMIYFNLNNLSGRILATTGLHLPNLKELDLGVNQLEGEIPLFITNASKLELLSLAQNFLTGTIPTNLGNLRELRELLLHTNQLTNEPRENELRFFNSLADCRMLRYLEVGFNPLNGVLPNSIGNLSSTIEKFHIVDAHINSLIPKSIGNLSGLTALIFQKNNLTGGIPSDVGKLKQLQGLYLTNNKLQGHIPEAVCHLSNLVQLNLQVNELSGLIPECLGNLSMLQLLYLGSNKFSSKLPLELWKMSGLLYLDVSQNSIEGEVPSDIGGLKAIVELYLYSNHFSGMIPTRFGELQNLQYLDLSNNSFFGQIPLSFANLISLEFLNLSSNALSDTRGGVFANSTLQSFLGNKGLCGMHILEIPACAITNPGKQSKLKEKKGKSKDVEKVLEIKTHQLISYHEIQRATNNFDESNLIAISKSVAYTETLGTLGYIAPEYGSEGIVSASGDVYSYDIMLMEVLTKRRPTDEEICNENLDLRKWITQSFSGTMMDVVDAKLFSEEEQITSKSEICIASMIELALECTKEMPDSRITMKEVVKRLIKIKNTFSET